MKCVNLAANYTTMKNIINFTISSAILLSAINCTPSEEKTTDAATTQVEKQAEVSYVDLGMKYALSTKAVLGKNLFNAINTKGTEGALDFCNIQAIPLTDSMSTVQKVKIKRVSDKNRNPSNAANDSELSYIATTKMRLADGEKALPQIREVGDKMVGYYPILANQMCLQCHGKPNEDIAANTLTKIKELYPNDKAVGYNVNELRGIWVVEMNKEFVLD